MRSVAKVCHVLMWIVLAVGVLFQSLGIAGIEFQKAEGKNNINTFWLGLAMVAMVVAVVLFVAMKKWKVIPFVLAVLAAVGLVFATFYVQVKIFGPSMEGVEKYGYTLTLGKLIYRHMLMVIEPVLMIPLFLVHLEDRREAKYAEEHEPVPSILDGMGDFTLSKLSEEDARVERKPRKR